MPRPRKYRRVCSYPRCTSFKPCGRDGQTVIMTIDEYEVIRLIDLEGFTQEQCSEQMEVARTTVQAIYGNARKKLAQCIVEGRPLQIDGGDVRVCEDSHSFCGKGCCRWGNYQENKEWSEKMRIAVTYEDGKVFQHFGHTEQFKIYEVEEGKVQNAFVIDANGSGHGALAGFLKQNGVDTLICGGIGGGAKNALAEAGIELYGGVSGDTDKAVDDLLTGNLSYNPDAACNHHDEGHHGEGHSCGSHHHGEEHSCGSHSEHYQG